MYKSYEKVGNVRGEEGLERVAIPTCTLSLVRYAGVFVGFSTAYFEVGTKNRLSIGSGNDFPQYQHP